MKSCAVALGLGLLPRRDVPRNQGEAGHCYSLKNGRTSHRGTPTEATAYNAGQLTGETRRWHKTKSGSLWLRGVVDHHGFWTRRRERRILRV